MNINELIQKAHANAKAKGFWDGGRNKSELLMLIVSECGEALEAHRNGRRADLSGFLRDSERSYGGMALSAGHDFGAEAERDMVDAFRRHVKDTFEDELADIVIRIADLLGSDTDLSRWAYDVSAENYDGAEGSFNIGEQLLDVVQMVASCGYGNHLCSNYHIAMNLGSAAMQCFAIAQHMNIDLWHHIKLKMSYNSSREYLHGKKY